MRELVRTNDAVLISAIEALLKGAHIGHMVVDQNMSVLEGSIGIFPRRILVDEDELENAQRLLEDAGFAHEIRRDGR
jgi:Putative prokaryotic signal transducing protein